MESETFHRNCFACGEENIDGLRLHVATFGSANTGSINLDKRFQGYEGAAQGGIVATILDSAMVRLLHSMFGGNPVTGRLNIRFLRATPVEKSIMVNAQFTNHRADIYWAEASIFDGTTCCATASGVFRIVSKEEPLFSEPHRRATEALVTF